MDTFLKIKKVLPIDATIAIYDTFGELVGVVWSHHHKKAN